MEQLAEAQEQFAKAQEQLQRAHTRVVSLQNMIQDEEANGQANGRRGSKRLEKQQEGRSRLGKSFKLTDMFAQVVEESRTNVTFPEDYSVHRSRLGKSYKLTDLFAQVKAEAEQEERERNNFISGARR